MAAVFLEVLGLVVTTILNAGEFGQTDTQKEGTTFKIHVGLNGWEGLDKADGDLPDVRVWNRIPDFVGKKMNPGDVEQGNAADVFVEHDNQLAYSLFSARDNAICIGWVTATSTANRGANEYAVTGNMAADCGGDWHYSGLLFSGGRADQSDEEEEDDAIPASKCFWIDANGDKPHTGFQVYWPDFGQDQFTKEKLKNINKEKYCDGITFGLKTEQKPSRIRYRTGDNKPRGFEELVNPGKSQKTRFKKRSEEMASSVIVDYSKKRSARELCDSPNSHGSDYANDYHREFCEMGDKVLYKYCDENDQGPCWDENKLRLRQDDRNRVGTSSEKAYKAVSDWRKK